MVTPIYPATSNQQAIDLNISNANQFFTILQGGIEDFIPTYEGNGEIPSVAKALNEAAAYKVPLPWQTTGEETDLLQPREFNDDIYVPLKVPAEFSTAPSNEFWRLYSEKRAQVLIDNITLTGDGFTTDFNIPSMVVDDPAAYLVSIDGVDQRPTIDYTVDVSTDTLSFTEAPPTTVADNISVTILGALRGAIAEEIYADTADGLANTSDGQFFNVVNTTDPEAFIDLYRNNAGAALLIDTYPNSVAYTNLANAVAYEADLASNSVGDGSDLVAHTGTADTVTEAVDKRVIRKSSVAEIEALSGVADYQVSLSGDRHGIFEFDSSNLFAEVSADTGQQKYIAPSGEDGSNGAWVRLKDYESDLSAGIVDDPAVDNTQAVLTLLQNRDDSSAEFVAKEIKTLQPSPLPTDWEKGNIEIFGTDVFLKSVWEHTLFPITEQDRSFLWVHSNTGDRVTSSVEGFNFTQVDSSTPGSGGANNHAIVKFNGTKNSHFSFNDIRTASLGVSFHYQLKGTGITDSRDVHGLALGNYFEDLEKQGIEFIAASYGRVLGNTIVGDRRNSNAIRLTGFDNNNDPFGNDSECLGVVGAANTVIGGRGGTDATAIAAQATAKYNYITATYIEDNTFGIFLKDGSVDPSGNPGKNFFSATMNGVGTGINNEGGENNVLDTIIFNYEDNGIAEIPPASAGSTAGTNTFRGQLIGGSNTTGRAVDSLHDNNHFDLVVVDAPTNVAGNTVNLVGNNYTGSIKVINSADNAIDVDGDGYNMDLTCVNGGATSNIIVNGSGNNLRYRTNNRFYILNGAGNVCSGESDDLRVDTAGNNVTFITDTAVISGSDNVFNGTSTGNFTVSGDNNVITGNVQGILDVSGNNNKFFGIAGTINDTGTGNTFL